MIDTIILRTNEIVLKGGNRHLFERALMNDVRSRLAPIGRFTVRGDQGNVLAVSEAPLDEVSIAAAEAALVTVFGVAWIVFAASVAKDLEAIKAEAAARMTGKTGTFKVFASRGDKRFPSDSPTIAREVGAHVLDVVPGLAVDVHDPQIRLSVEVGAERAYVAAGRVAGAGGLPSGSGGTVVAMLSGGIDSPVAAWKLMRRSCRVVFVHCHSYPYVGSASIDKVRRLAAALGRYQRGSVLWNVPIGDAQRDITAKADETVRVLLYRRLMLRIAERIAERERGQAIVTGDSVGQVASQTLENIAAVSTVAGMPIFRPLVGDDKEDIVRAAKRIGTYAISIEPHDDCCSLFVPRRPATKSSAAALDAEEAKYDVGAAVEAAVAKAERAVVDATVAAPVAA